MTRIEKIAKEHLDGIILREKDLSADEYKTLAKSVLKICEKYNTTCILHSFVDVANELNCTAIHLPLPLLRTLSTAEKAQFTILGTSCHSIEEAKEAESLGCTYIIAGHIFETDCKKGLPGRGLAFLKAVCESVSIPVFAIGGIDAGNVHQVRDAGASGACIMSGLMTCDELTKYFLPLLS